MVLQTPCFEGALNPSGFQGEKLGCLEGAGSGFGCWEQVVVGVRRGRAAGQVCGLPGPIRGSRSLLRCSPCVQYIVLLLYISQDGGESLTVFPEL